MSTVIGVPVTAVWAAPDAPRELDRPIIGAVPDPDLWNRFLAADPPSALHDRTATQALLGEPVTVVGERSGWLEVILPWQPSSADPAGYPGWIPAAHVHDAEPTDSPRVVVTAPTLQVGQLTLSYGTILPVVEQLPSGWRVSLPDGRTEVVATDLIALPGPSETPDIDSLLASAAQFVGLRYLWGGTGGWGFDCSGFVHLVHRRFGRTVPRDAFDQVVATDSTPLENAGPGDLYFFGRPAARVTHVGFVTNGPDAEPTILHAPDGDAAQRIEDVVMPPERRSKLVAAGSFLRRPAAAG